MIVSMLDGVSGETFDNFRDMRLNWVILYHLSGTSSAIIQSEGVNIECPCQVPGTDFTYGRLTAIERL